MTQSLLTNVGNLARTQAEQDRARATMDPAPSDDEIAQTEVAVTNARSKRVASVERHEQLVEALGVTTS